MRIVFGVFVVLVAVDSATSLPKERMKRWSRDNAEHVVAPGFQPISLHDYRRMNIFEKYNDETVGLTVIKDPSPDVRACFIADLDPEWSLTSMDKMEIITSQEPMIIRSPMDFEELQQKAGSTITDLCKKLHIFWMNVQLPLPVPKAPGSNSQGPPELIKSPPSLSNSPPQRFSDLKMEENVNQVKTPPRLFKVPPPLKLHESVEAPENEMKTPPPLMKSPSALHIAYQSPVENVEESVHQMKTPPPLIKEPPSLHLANNSPLEHIEAPVHQMKAPPPLIREPPALSLANNSPLEHIEAPVHQMKTPPGLFKKPPALIERIEAPLRQMKTPPPLFKVPPPLFEVPPSLLNAIKSPVKKDKTPSQHLKETQPGPSLLDESPAESVEEINAPPPPPSHPLMEEESHPQLSINDPKPVKISVVENDAYVRGQREEPDYEGLDY